MVKIKEKLEDVYEAIISIFETIGALLVVLIIVLISALPFILLIFAFIYLLKGKVLYGLLILLVWIILFKE